VREGRCHLSGHTRAAAEHLMVSDRQGLMEHTPKRRAFSSSRPRRTGQRHRRVMKNAGRPRDSGRSRHSARYYLTAEFRGEAGAGHARAYCARSFPTSSTRQTSKGDPPPVTGALLRVLWTSATDAGRRHEKQMKRWLEGAVFIGIHRHASFCAKDKQLTRRRRRALHFHRPYKFHEGRCGGSILD